MTFDGLFTRAMTYELEEILLNGRIDKIVQVSTYELTISVRKFKKNYTLLLSSHPQSARVQLITSTIPSPKEPPRFCTVLRKHILGGIVEEISQPSLERIIVFLIRHRNEIGDDSYKEVVVEVMGKHSNILCIEKRENVIIDCIKHVSADINRVRTLLPGHFYLQPPQQNKENLLEIANVELDNVTSENIVKKYMGISPFFAKQITTKEQLIHYATEAKKNAYTPSLLINDQKQEYFYHWSLPTYKSIPFGSCSELLSRYYFSKMTRDRMKQQTMEVEKKVQSEINKNVLKIKKLKQQLKNTESADLFKKYGELLTANIFSLEKGQTSIKVIDYYDDNQPFIEIPLDVTKKPSQNAQKYFKKYQKLKKSVLHIKEQIEHAEIENDYLEGIITQLEMATPTDFAEIQTELVEGKYLRKQKQHKKIPKKAKVVLEKFVASDGTPIFAGKNNKQNEYLTMNYAHKNDIWLHVKDIPGSHIIIKGTNPSQETLTEAALIAAYYSKARNSSQVAVDYTEIRHVKKKPNGKPGNVTYDKQKTLYVTPNEDIIFQLKTRC